MRKIKTLEKIALAFAILGGATFVGFLIALLFGNQRIGYPIDHEYTSMVGDFLTGTVGVLWSGASVILFYAALKFQRDELEVALQNNADSNEAYINQLKAINFQRTVDVYYNLLKKIEEMENELHNKLFRYYTTCLLDNEDETFTFATGFQVISRKYFLYLEEYGVEVKQRGDNRILDVFADRELRTLFTRYGERFNALLSILDPFLSSSSAIPRTLINELFFERDNDSFMLLLFYANYKPFTRDFLFYLRHTKRLDDILVECNSKIKQNIASLYKSSGVEISII